MHRIATLLALAFSLLLAGCFASQEPKFAAGTAVRVFGDGGRYATFERIEGKDSRSDPLVVRPRADGAYDFINEKGEATAVSLHAIPGGLHVAQVTLEGGQGYGYILFRIAGNEVLVVPADCDKQDKTQMQALGVELRGRFECWVDGVKDAGTFFAALKRGEPISKMVRE